MTIHIWRNVKAKPREWILSHFQDGGEPVIASAKDASFLLELHALLPISAAHDLWDYEISPSQAHWFRYRKYMNAGLSISWHG